MIHSTACTQFGEYRLFASERLLLRGDDQVEIGGRALDILVVLTEHAGLVVSKKDLMTRVWDSVHVEESTLRVHIANLRKAIGDGDDGARYIVGVPGRGYSFVGAVRELQEPARRRRSSARSEPHRGTPRR